MSDRIGQQLGNYRITRLLGRGGFAEVYLGEHIYLKTPVAIKLLHTSLAVADDQGNFLNEARTVARLVHPNIIRVTDFGIDHETPYLVMDYAPNGTLRQRHPRNMHVPVPTVVSYVKQIAAALQYAHEEKLVHRDIKPENMLIGRRDEILLGDFGIALVAQTSRSSSTQDVVGTVAYMSPEQIQGKPRFASDQYSLAVVVYEWLGGVLPFQGSFTELCTQHVFASPPSLRDHVPDLPQEAEQVVMIALAKDPKQRFGSIQAFANALEQASQGLQPKLEQVQQASQPIPSLTSTQQAGGTGALLAIPDASSGKISGAQQTDPPANLSSGPTRTTDWPPPPPPGFSGGMPAVPAQMSDICLPSKEREALAPRGAFLNAYGYEIGQAYPSYPPSPSFSTPQQYYPQLPYPARPASNNTWSFGGKQVFALLVSLALINLSEHFVVIFNGLGTSFYPALAIALFCYSAFGPWVGLLAGGLNIILEVSVHYPAWAFFNGTFHTVPQQYLIPDQINWTLVGSGCVIGFLVGATGFNTFYKQARFSRFGAILLADLLAGILSFGYDIVVFFALQYNRYEDFTRYLGNSYFMLLGITLVVLSVLLLFYSRIFPRTRA